MVQLHGILLLKTKNIEDSNKPIILSGHFNIPSLASVFSGKIKKAAIHIAKNLAKQVKGGDKGSLRLDENVGYAASNKSGLTCVLVADHEYPKRVCYDIIDRMMDQFSLEYQKSNILSTTKTLKDFCLSGFNKDCKALLVKYKDPTEVDEIYRSKKKVKEVQDIMENNLTEMMKRGVDIEEVQEKIYQLDNVSFEFYKKQKKCHC